jgi:hypothetical protein
MHPIVRSAIPFILSALLWGCMAETPTGPAPGVGESAEQTTEQAKTQTPTAKPTSGGQTGLFEPIVIGGRGATYTSQERDQVCAGIVAVNLQEAFQRTPPHQTILWTFGVNFDLLTEAGDPIGCLRLYQRDDASQTFVAVDDGGVAVISCRIEPAGPTISNGEALFAGEGGIECAMDLQDWVREILPLLVKQATGLSYAEELNSNLESFVANPTHELANFTMVARLHEVEPVGALAPVLYYQPRDLQSEAPALYVDIQAGIVFPGSSCAVPLPGPTPHFWWYDLRQDSVPYQAGGSSFLYYAWQDAGAPPQTDCLAPNVEFVLEKTPFQLSIGPASLYIGYDPATSETLHGTVDGILVDPADSKPPAS